MTFIPLMRNRSLSDGIASASGNRIGGWIVIAILLLLLAAAGVIGYLGWTISNADVPTSGYVAMALGVVFSLAVGVGLMALVFYSSRQGFDEPAKLILDSDESSEFETHSEQKRR